jgi:protein required for attachment to host cells
MKTWVAVVNRCEARLFEMNPKGVDKNGRDHEMLKLVQRIENPKGRLRNGEIDADRPGFSKSKLAFSGTRLSKSQEPTDRVAEMFAKSISEELDKHHSDHRFENLILVVEPHFLGKVRAALSKKTFNTITDTLHKDLAHVADHDVPSFIWPKKEEISPVL